MAKDEFNSYEKEILDLLKNADWQKIENDKFWQWLEASLPAWKNHELEYREAISTLIDKKYLNQKSNQLGEWFIEILRLPNRKGTVSYTHLTLPTNREV